MFSDELKARLRESFATELAEHVARLDDDLLAVEKVPGDGERLRSLFRSAHTLKGAARAAGVLSVERLCHVAESKLAEARDGERPLGRDDIDSLFDITRALGEVSEQLQRGETIPEPSGAKVVETRSDGPSVPRMGAQPDRGGASATGPERTVPAPRSVVRISAEKLDRLQAAVASLHTEVGRVAEFTSATRSLAAIFESRARGPEELREARRLGASARRILRSLDRVADDVISATRAVRLRPFKEACEQLPRAVRDLATATGKEVDLVVEDRDVEVDRAVVDALRHPLLQLVRNAVDHGIETPEARRAAGKSPRGKVRICARAAADRLTVEVSDDGAGIDVEGLQERLPEGLPSEGGDGFLVEALMRAGVSTRAKAGPISGRGVGLDIVREAVADIHGSVGVRWTSGRGTTFKIETPVSLATSTVILTRVQSWTMALPARFVERVMMLRPDAIRRAQGKDLLLHEGGSLPLCPLARLLGPPFREAPTGPDTRIVLLRAGAHRAAVLVDGVIDASRILIEPATHAGVEAPLVAGASTLPSGEVVPVLDVPTLLVSAGWSVLGSEPLVGTAPGSQRARVMVVDDSITTRTLETSVLESSGFEVIAAADGGEAWELLGSEEVDVVVSDVEMPRMDGFDLCRAIRSSVRNRKLPVILVTARESPEDRRKGLDSGADAYLAKSSFDHVELVDTIRRLLPMDRE